MQRQLKLHVLGTGSKGNASIVEDARTGRGVLIDCGICKRDFFAACDEAGFDPAALDAIFITHEHTDHTKGLGVVLRGFRKLGIEAPALYVHDDVLNASADLIALGDLADIRSLRLGESVRAGGLDVLPFETSHDAASSCGFRVESDDDALGFMTDTGIVTGAAHEALQRVRILALESNHDLRMLDAGPYPYAVRKRIASARGHLNNEQAAEELATLLSDELEQVVAMHISENNNTYRLPAQTLASVVEREGAQVAVQAGYQKRLVSVG